MATPRPKIKVVPRISIRVPLHDHEWERLHELREETGLSIGRLVADAVRAVHLGKPGTDFGDARGVRSAGGME